MRLIDADVLIEKIKTDEFTHVRNEYQLGYNDGLFHAEVVADNMPTVDAMPVIRCRDCARNPKYVARTHCPCPMDRYMGEDGWCAMARRKEE